MQVESQELRKLRRTTYKQQVCMSRHTYLHTNPHSRNLDFNNSIIQPFPLLVSHINLCTWKNALTALLHSASSYGAVAKYIPNLHLLNPFLSPWPLDTAYTSGLSVLVDHLYNTNLCKNLDNVSGFPRYISSSSHHWQGRLQGDCIIIQRLP